MCVKDSFSFYTMYIMNNKDLFHLICHAGWRRGPSLLQSQYWRGGPVWNRLLPQRLQPFGHVLQCHPHQDLETARTRLHLPEDEHRRHHHGVERTRLRARSCCRTFSLRIWPPPEIPFFFFFRVYFDLYILISPLHTTVKRCFWMLWCCTQPPPTPDASMDRTPSKRERWNSVTRSGFAHSQQ